MPAWPKAPRDASDKCVQVDPVAIHRRVVFISPMPGNDLMARAATAARRLRATTAGQRGAAHSVYVILLHDPARRDPWGLYVGQTARDPDWRFDQHKAGYKASAAVRRHGVRLLPELSEHLNTMRGWEALEIEAALAEAFRATGINWVEGGH